eukprot:gene14371-15869_t
MLADVELQLQNAQHSILFLQSEHACTITGLHNEINTLQQKCADLNFQLAMKNDTTETKTDILSNNETFKASHDLMQKELKALKEEFSQLKGESDSKDKRINLLEGQLKSKEQKFLNDLKLAQKHNTELKSELDSKGNTIAYLTSQLHQIKSQTHKSRGITPTPPQDGSPPKSHVRRKTSPSPILQSVSSDHQMELASHHLNTSEFILQTSLPSKIQYNLPSRPAQSIHNPARPALGHSFLRRDRELQLLHRQQPSDYKDIINAQRSTENEVTPKPPTDPLPPILAGKSSRRVRSKQSDKSRQNARRVSSNGEITEVVIEPVGSPERVWKKAQNSSRQ